MDTTAVVSMPLGLREARCLSECDFPLKNHFRQRSRRANGTEHTGQVTKSNSDVSSYHELVRSRGLAMI